LRAAGADPREIAMKFPRASSMSKGMVTLMLAVFAALVLIGINEVGHDRSTRALDSMSREFETRASLDRLVQNLLDAETGSRGFLLTGDPRYLEPYNAAVASIGRNLDALREAYRGSPAESAMLEQLSRNAQRKLADVELSVRMRREGREESWNTVLLTDVGKEQMDAIREVAGRLAVNATARIEQSRQQVRHTLMIERGAIALATLVALLAFWLYRRQTIALELAGERQQQVLQQERDLLEQQVRDRTATLAELATHLQQVREEERGHLARELHDELGALLTAAKLDVARLKSRLGPEGSEVVQRLQHLTETLNSGIALKRRIIEDLRPSSLSNLGLTASLEILAREFSERSGVEVTTSLEPVELDEAQQLTAYRLVQESLTNMAKYAQARHAEIAVHGMGALVEVAVRDDGKGFEPVRSRPSTHGLAGMRHRVEAAGGRLTVESQPGNGTRVAAVLPALVTQS
jgi:signal transduction histidine kinase